MKILGIAAVLASFLSLGIAPVLAQQAVAAAPAAAAPTVKPPPPPELLFRMALENTTRKPFAQDLITNPNLRLQAYGDGKSILVSIGAAETDPHLFDGLCDKPCGLTLADKNNFLDLSGKAKIKWTTIVSGFHRARPLVKLADGTLLIGDQADGSTADWQQSEVSLSELRWMGLDPVRGVTVGRWIEHPNLTRVDEIGFFDVIPGSGTPPGGWIALSAFEVWGKTVTREGSPH